MIELTDWLRAELERRAAAEAPEEACGLISQGKRGIALWGAENAAADPLTSFLIAPEAQVGILEQMWKRKEELVGVYHSHPRSGPEPSQADRAVAAELPPLTWVIVGRKPCECLPVPMMGGVEDNDLIPDGDCSVCGDVGTLPDFWIGTLP